MTRSIASGSRASLQQIKSYDHDASVLTEHPTAHESNHLEKETTMKPVLLIFLVVSAAFGSVGSAQGSADGPEPDVTPVEPLPAGVVFARAHATVCTNAID